MIRTLRQDFRSNWQSSLVTEFVTKPIAFAILTSLVSF